MPFYAVGRGLVIGIYSDWLSCKKNIENFKNAKYKKFDNEKDALEFIENCKDKEKISDTISLKEPIVKKIIIEDNIEDDILHIFTDGACSNNGKLNSNAGIGIYFGEDDKRNVSKKIDGKQTNNVAELLAIIEALKIIRDEKKDIVICTDSEYSIKCATGYGKKLSLNNWKNAEGKEPPNVDLVKEIYTLSKRGNISYKYIIAHTEGTDFFSNGNRQADLLAKKSVECFTADFIETIYVTKIYLNVAYKDKDNAKSLGARWCPEKKQWYYNSNIDKEKEEKLLELYKII